MRSGFRFTTLRGEDFSTGVSRIFAPALTVKRAATPGSREALVAISQVVKVPEILLAEKRSQTVGCSKNPVSHFDPCRFVL